jgi:hypothetical protein
MLIITTGVVNAGEMGYITITSEPTAADVWIDNVPAGRTPIRNRPLVSGGHIIRLLDKSTQRTITESVTIIEDSSTILHIPLLKKYGALTVDTDPQGAAAELVTRLGNTPVNAERLIPGAYTLRLRHPKNNYQSVCKNIFIPEGQVEPIKETLPKDRPYIAKKWVRIGLGAAGIGMYTWGFIELKNDRTVPSVVGFSLGTLFVLGIEIVSFL